MALSIASHGPYFINSSTLVSLLHRFKIFVFDSKEVYVGSANLTGTGIGMKAETTRNFEAGILTDDPEIVEQAMNGRSSERHQSLLEDARVVTDEDEVNQFDEVWIGKHCKICKRRDFCPDPIA